MNWMNDLGMKYGSVDDLTLESTVNTEEDWNIVQEDLDSMQDG